MAERVLCMDEVKGSMPLSSMRKKKRDTGRRENFFFFLRRVNVLPLFLSPHVGWRAARARALHGCRRAAAFAATAAAPKPWSLAASGSSPPGHFKNLNRCPSLPRRIFCAPLKLNFFFFLAEVIYCPFYFSLVRSRAAHPLEAAGAR